MNFIKALFVSFVVVSVCVAQSGWMISMSSDPNSLPPYYIWHTTNGGVNWSVQYTDNTSGSFNAIQFTDLNNGWVVGEGGKILKTTDGGNNWNRLPVDPGFPQSVNAVFLLDANKAWIGGKISGNSPVLLSTSDGGQMWSSEIITIQSKIFSICFADSNNGWLTSDPDKISHTADTAGGLWELQTNPTSNMLGKIQFVSSTEGWISTGRGQLLHTTNAGANWTIVNPFPNDTVISMSDPAVSMSWTDKNHGWKIGWFGTGFTDAHGAVIYQTADGGGTWQKKVLSTAIGDAGIQVQFVDEKNGWASVGNLLSGKGSFMRSTDGGNNWSPITTSVGGIFYFVGAISGIKGKNNNLLKNFSIFNQSKSGVAINFSLLRAERVTVKVYTLTGAEIASVVDKKLTPGASSLTWDTRNLSAGCYIVKMQIGSEIYAKSIPILK